jgi:hypothetical protein
MLIYDIIVTLYYVIYYTIMVNIHMCYSNSTIINIYWHCRKLVYKIIVNRGGYKITYFVALESYQVSLKIYIDLISWICFCAPNIFYNGPAGINFLHGDRDGRKSPPPRPPPRAFMKTGDGEFFSLRQQRWGAIPVGEFRIDIPRECSKLESLKKIVVA